MAAKHYTAKIPFKRLIKIGIMSNQKTKYALSTAYSKLRAKYPGKEVYIINGGFFDMKSFKAIFDLKADGVTYSKQFSMAYMGMINKDIHFDFGEKNSSKYTDIVSAYPILIEAGKKSPNYERLDKQQRGRSMLGYNANEVIISCIQDVSDTSDYSIDEELSYMLSQKCQYAINLDGGGSSQCNFNGKTITSTRKVNNFIYAIAEPEVVESISKNSYKVTATALNIRSTYSVKGKITGLLKKNQIVEITDIKSGWGKLKDGRGWINLSYTKKVN